MVVATVLCLCFGRQEPVRRGSHGRSPLDTGNWTLETVPMLSRVADSVYWMARYVERAENVARFVDVNLQLNLDLPDNSPGQWMSLVYTAGDDADFLLRY